VGVFTPEGQPGPLAKDTLAVPLETCLLLYT